MSDLKQLSEHFENNCSFLEQKYIVDFINIQRKNSNNNKIKTKKNNKNNKNK